MATTHFPNGLTTTEKFTVYGEYILPDPSTTHTYFEDFNSFTIAEWDIGTSGSGTKALTDEDGGVLLLTNSSGATDSIGFSKDGESFQFEAGKKTWFKSRIKFSTSLVSWVMGLQITDTTPVLVDHGVWLSSAKGTTDIVLTATKQGIGTSLVTLTSEDFSGEFFTVAFFYDGKNLITGYVNDIALGSITAENIPDTEILTIQFFIENSAAQADTMSIDYILSSKER